MHRTTALLCTCLLYAVCSSYARDPEFSQENAFAIVKTLAEEIGPRPMGSPSEARALAFAAAKFAQYGCQESYVMPMTVAEGVNTKSGIAVGVLKGKTGRIVVIGGHVDSQGPEVPGANDDASGAACVIELARVLAGQQHQSTVLFCCWGGEEQGLQGSRYFVRHYDMIDSVVLMLQIDMADGAGRLEIDPDAIEGSAPRWLVKAAYDVFYRELGYSGLVYPTHSATLNLAVGGAYGSDHAEFLARGIPAICFTSDITFPIHTPQDRIENFTPSGLKRSGDLVLGLFERFDAGTPSRSTERYDLVQVGTLPVLLPFWGLWICVAIAVVVSLVAFGVSRHRSHGTVAIPGVRWSGLKLSVFAVLLQVFIWYSGSIISMIRGYRFPWVNNVGGFVLLGIFAALLAIWLVLQITRQVRMSSDQFVYARIAFLAFLIIVVSASFEGPRLAIYPALGLFLFSLAVLVRYPLMKLILMLASLYPILRLFFNESLQFTLRNISQGTSGGQSTRAVLGVGYVVVFTMLSIPFVFGFAGLYVESWKGRSWVDVFRSKAGLAGVCVALTAVSLYLVSRPVYDRLWCSAVRVEQAFVLGSDSSEITLRGSDYLGGIRITMDGRDSLLTGRSTFQRLEPRGISAVPWCTIEREDSPGARASAADTVSTIVRNVYLHSQKRPLQVQMTYGSTGPFVLSSPWSMDSRRRWGPTSDVEKVLTWRFFPDSSFVVPVTLSIHDGQKITERIEVIYASLAYPIQVTREFTNVTMRTIVTARDTIQIRQKSQYALLK